jgi:lipopolysaccharide biosynthesis glycosyltransferase
MLVPALFVADAVRSCAAGSPNPYDVIVFSQPSEVSADHLAFMRERGILFRGDLDMSRLSTLKKFSGRLTAATLMKLSLAGHLGAEYERLLYLDCDLTIHGDVGRLFALDTGLHALAAVPSGRIMVDLSERRRNELLAHFKALGMTEPYRFFNTGVLYIDVAKWNRADLGERALAYIAANPDLCVLPDEDALNAVLDGAFAELSPVWNARPRVTDGGRWRFSLPVVVHYAGPDKPWKRYGWRKRLFPDRTAYRLYETFLAGTPWPTWLDEQWGARDLLASFAWELKRLSRRLRGKLDEPTAAQRRANDEVVRAYYRDTAFVDVEQGIVERIDGKLRLAGTRPTGAGPSLS